MGNERGAIVDMDHANDLAEGDYRPRPIRHLSTQTVQGWHLKTYGINAMPQRSDDVLDPDVEAAAARVGHGLLEGLETSNTGRYGFLIIHQGGLANWLLVNRWAEDILLRSELFRAGHDAPTDFQPETSDLIGCLWELEVVDFERRAWTEAVIKGNGGVDRYMATVLNADV
ncbi:MAG: hypothetical protein F4W98_01065 [Acidimicrobiales bacterium]|nr:hypothetical protein [Acidimicrobiales bacterium]